MSGPPGQGVESLGRIGVSLCDINAGLNALIGIQQALMQRERTGRGSGVKVSLFDSAAELMSVPYLQTRYGGRAPERVGLKHPSIAPYGAWMAASRRRSVRTRPRFGRSSPHLRPSAQHRDATAPRSNDRQNTSIESAAGRVSVAEAASAPKVLAVCALALQADASRAKPGAKSCLPLCANEPTRSLGAPMLSLTSPPTRTG